jgi:hypothetical protein
MVSNSGSLRINQEWIDAGKVVGKYVDEFYKEYPTTKFRIDYSNTGTHIIPLQPWFK